MLVDAIPSVFGDVGVHGRTVLGCKMLEQNGTIIVAFLTTVFGRLIRGFSCFWFIG